MRCTRSLILSLGLLLAFSVAGAAQSLREKADRAGVLIGAAVNVAYLSEPAYTGTLAREFNMLEPEDAMKWAAIRPDEKTFDFTDADRLVAFAEAHILEDHGMKVRGHTLVWGTDNPKWLAEGHFTAGQLHDLLHEHIRRVVGHYRGKVFAWDVVNEAFRQHGALRDTIWYNQPGIGLAGNGTAYIEQAFRWAHEADPRALLFYNDAEAETINRKSDAIYAMVQDFKRRGVPSDGIGLQMHIFNLSTDAASIAANIERFTKLGVQIHITEMDVALPVDATGNPLHPADLQQQAELYRQIAADCLQHPGCTAIQTWGFTDKYSWLGWFTHGTQGDGLLFDREYRPKAAYDTLYGVFALPHAH
jgi:endo-1,4-beta-xylanase